MQQQLHTTCSRLVSRALRLSLVMLGMWAGSGADAQYLFAEDVLGYPRGHKPRHARTCADFAFEYQRLQDMRVSAFSAFREEVGLGSCARS